MSVVVDPAAGHYTAAQISAIDQGLEDARAGRFASDDVMEAYFTRFRQV